MNVGEPSGRRLCTGLRLDYRLRLWTPTSASRAISEVVELLLWPDYLATEDRPPKNGTHRHIFAPVTLTLTRSPWYMKLN